jgi:hypothetical protein
MNSLERLKAAMKTETTISAIATKAKVPPSMVHFHLKEQSQPGKRLIIVKD